MSQQPSGWYDDPSDPALLRYWDGVMWTNHTAPRRSPTASQSTIGHVQQSGPVVPHAPAVPAAPPARGGSQPPVAQGGGAWQAAPGYPQAPANANWMHELATTADGVPLASWGQRFGAWLVDLLILGLFSLVLWRILAPDVWSELGRTLDVASTGDQAAIEQATENWSAMVTAAALKLGIAQFLLVFGYCVAFWTTRGQTPGKMAVGISVRRVDRPGPLDLGTAIRRRILSLIQVIPLLSVVWFVVWPLDGLWPLWDDKRQTLHDKIASTQVVQGKQPRRQG